MKKLVLLLLILILGCSAEEGCEPTPSLITNDATDITDVSATISGTITPPTCEETVTSQGFVFGESNLPTVEDNRIIKSGTNISHSLSNLKQNTTYYVRTFFENPTGVYYGNEITLSTAVGDALITLGNFTEISTSSVKTTVAINSNGGGNISEKGLCFSISTQPTTQNNKLNFGVGNGGFTATIQDLNNYTLYYVRAYAINEKGTFYSDEKSFRTLDFDDDDDGIYNFEDNCINTPNPEQEDQDDDGIGDVCDDSDQDGVFDSSDNCINTPNPEQEDNDEDSIGDVCDDDIDGDNVLNSQDNCNYNYNPNQEDTDGDGIGDYCDDDSLIYVPDDAFEAYLEGDDFDNDDYVIAHYTFNVTSIGTVDEIWDGGETVNFTSVQNGGLGVVDLTGIEGLTNLEEININTESINYIDLSENSKLKKIRIYSYPDSNTGTEHLNQINFPNNNQIEILNLHSSINEYQFEKFDNLKQLSLMGNIRIENINLFNFPELEFFQANILIYSYGNNFRGGLVNSPNFSNNPNLKTLIIQFAQFKHLDLSMLNNLEYVNVDYSEIECIKVNAETLERIENQNGVGNWFIHNGNNGSSSVIWGVIPNITTANCD